MFPVYIGSPLSEIDCSRALTAEIIRMNIQRRACALQIYISNPSKNSQANATHLHAVSAIAAKVNGFEVKLWLLSLLNFVELNVEACGENVLQVVFKVCGHVASYECDALLMLVF